MQMNPNNIPKALKDKGLWCVWRYEERDGKPTKVPYNPQTGNRARPNEKQDFSGFETALNAFERGGFDGLGIGIFPPLAAVDIDHCAESGKLTDMAAEIIERIGSYTEYSPSGKGVHIVFTVPDGFNYDKETFYINNRALGLEVYVAGCTYKFITITGDIIGGDLTNGGNVLDDICRKYMMRKQPMQTARGQASPYPPPADDWFDTALKYDPHLSDYWNGFFSTDNESEKDASLMSRLMYWTNNNAEIAINYFMRSPFVQQKDAEHYRKLQRADYLPRTAKAVRAERTAASDNAEWERKKQTKKNTPQDVFSSFGFYTIDSLTEEEKKPPEFIVENMIPVGMTFLSGAPKIRKSFLALQMAYSVATGTEFLGFKTVKTSVAYFDLEGSKSRISSRTYRMGKFPDNVFITNSTDKKLSDGLAEQIEALYKQRPDIRLYIIDTYSRARGMVKSYGANAYDVDVQFLEPIQRIAINNKIAILFVHHDKKNAAATPDSFERLSGTMGISGSADSVLNLIAQGKRFDGKAMLEFTPRDARGGEIQLAFNELSGIWTTIQDTQGNIEDDEVIQWCIRTAPDKTKIGDFYSYSDVYTSAFNGYSDRAGSIVSERIKKGTNYLFYEKGIAIQTGVQSHGRRGVRIFRVK